MAEEPGKERGMLSNILLGYLILVLHIFLIVFISVSVVFFEGIYEYKVWILLGTLALIGGSGYFFFRKIRGNTRQIREVLNDPMFRDRAVEINFLGGMASVRMGQPGEALPGAQLIAAEAAPVQQLEDPATQRLRELSRLADMLEKKLITEEEFLRLKQPLLQQENDDGHTPTR